MELRDNDLAEIATLSERAEKLSRRRVLSAGKLAFVVPVLGAFAIPREALGNNKSDRSAGSSTVRSATARVSPRRLRRMRRRRLRDQG